MPGLGEAAPREPPEQNLQGERSWPPAAHGLTAQLARELRGQGWGVLPGVHRACGSGQESGCYPSGSETAGECAALLPLVEGGSGWGVRLGCRGDPLQDSSPEEVVRLHVHFGAEPMRLVWGGGCEAKPSARSHLCTSKVFRPRKPSSGRPRLAIL